ncbi:MAG: hypothetical protein HQ464_02060, partial [Planctomycetes bacterium]|nr:hypothetical protein [Planctomycetota bacterium]
MKRFCFLPLAVMLVMLVMLVMPPLAQAEVRVLGGSAAGRTSKEPDPAAINEPFAVAFDAAGRLYGVEYSRGNRLFR